MTSDVDLTPADNLPIDPDAAKLERRWAGAPASELGAIAAGGALGGPTRYGLGLAFPTAPHTFPLTTFVINVSGSFVLALLLVFILDIWPPSTYVRPFFCVGFLGAYTTFSTWMVDTDRLIAAGTWGPAAGNLAGSLIAGVAATSLGLLLGRGIAERRHKDPPEDRLSALATSQKIGGRP